jgi:transposase InsO family protein
VVIDLCSRKIIDWSLADNLRNPLVTDAHKQAIGSRSTSQKLVFHSDRGNQCGSAAYRQILRQAGMRQSMSARANPYHNDWTESFMGTLKVEILQDGCFIDAHDARTEIFIDIDFYYNTQRKHSALGYQTPAQFGAQILPLK